MLTLDQLKDIGKLLDEIDNLTNKLQDAYNENNATHYNYFKQKILETQNKISVLLQ